MSRIDRVANKTHATDLLELCVTTADFAHFLNALATIAD